MAAPKDQKKNPSSIGWPMRLGVGLVAALIAGTAAHLFLNDAITTGVAAVFFGLGAAISLGQGGGPGGDAGSGFADGGGAG